MNFRPQYIDMDTPQGKLSLTWPQPQPIYAETLEPIAYDDPQDPGPLCLLNGKEITVEEAKAIVADMAGKAQRS